MKKKHGYDLMALAKAVGADSQAMATLHRCPGKTFDEIWNSLYTGSGDLRHIACLARLRIGHTTVGPWTMEECREVCIAAAQKLGITYLEMES